MRVNTFLVFVAIFFVLISTYAQLADDRRFCSSLTIKDKICTPPKIFDLRLCSCYCPFSQESRTCSRPKVWNNNKCACECRNQIPAEGCGNGLWSKLQCKCLKIRSGSTSNELTTTIPHIISTFSTTQSLTQSTSPLTTTIATTPAPKCSFGTGKFNNDITINGISAGISLANKEVYPAFILQNGVTIIGGLQSRDSMTAGFSYAHNNKVDTFIRENVLYLTQTTGCNCQFVPKDTDVPQNGQLVTFNEGTTGVGLTTYYFPQYNYSDLTIGSINTNTRTLHFLDIFNYAEATTTDYKKLICLPTILTIPSKASTKTPTLPQFIDLRFPEFDIKVKELREATSNFLQHYSNVLDDLHAAIFDPKTPSDDIPVLKNIVNVLTNGPHGSALYKLVFKKKRQIDIRKQRQMNTTCQQAIDEVDSLHSLYTFHDDLTPYLDSLLSRILHEYIKKVNIKLPRNTFQSLDKYTNYRTSLRNDLEDLKDPMHEMENLIKKDCNFTMTSNEKPTTLASIIST